ncbi:pyruvate, phosphate dikinase [Haloprofundus marisrubri]|uniref:Probable phosphoenolpyruvate synthase n=1 Tax=Haloprofundus marisrubri TaxID=1514971 RepID=A0A0W1RAC6_9EURY|nr:PEP/pyruvate-binding domain-containing protein [Haloprofundus marisrubri]KTG10618.1 pyruvate, phosphate dikinase [Haloprofundus marisrubri]
MNETKHTAHSDPFVVDLADPSATDRTLVGGKSANVARLVTAGIPVPGGFCVTTAAYRTLVDDETIRTAVRALSDLDPAETDALAQAGEYLRDLIRARPIPAALREAIERAVADEDEATSFAVRSSATAEDLPDASFAGQQETYLNVPEERLEERVRDCMASLFTDRAIAYRARNGIDHESVSIAVLVQRMVDADSSGILFTADPTTGNRRVAAIEAGVGLGEALVSGEVSADSVRVDRETGEILDYQAGVQTVAVRPATGGGVERVDRAVDERGDRSAPDDRALTDDDVRTLVETGAEIEALFESPQDIEWCFADGDLFVLQSRPITSLFPVPSPAPADDRLHVYYSVGHAQALPEAMPPLVRDVWLSYAESSLAAFGFDSESSWGVEAGGRVYVDITNVLRIDALRDDVPEFLGSISEPMSVALTDLLARRGDEFRTERSRRERATSLPRVAGRVWAGLRRGYPLVRLTLAGFFGAFVGDPEPPRYEEALWTVWGVETADEIEQTEPFVERVRTPFDLYAVVDQFGSLPRIGPLYAALLVDSWLRRRFAAEAADDVNAVGRGFPAELVTRLNLGLGDLADLAREHPQVADALREGASLDELHEYDGGEAFCDAFDEYLREFGHRGTGEIDISRPRWREDPSGLLATVRANLEHGESGDHHEHLRRMEREAAEAADRLENRVDHGVLGPIRRRVLRQLLTTYRGYIQTREYPKQGVAHLFAAWREVLLEAGESLVADGRLDEVDDVWFLRRDELLAASEGESLSVDIAARRAEFERHAAMDAPPILTSEGEAPNPVVSRDDVPAGALVGTGVSGGVVEGVARVVRDPTKETIEKGEILVAPSADPGWTPLFLNAAGMVVEVGGRMSHGALVAREYGLPAVVSVPRATRTIETGQRLRVDGTRGVVEFVD